MARLFKDDMIAYHEEGWPRIGRVAGFSTTTNKLRIAPHFLDGSGEYVSINVLGAAGRRKLRAAPRRGPSGTDLSQSRGHRIVRAAPRARPATGAKVRVSTASSAPNCSVTSKNYRKS